MVRGNSPTSHHREAGRATGRALFLATSILSNTLLHAALTLAGHVDGATIVLHGDLSILTGFRRRRCGGRVGVCKCFAAQECKVAGQVHMDLAGANSHLELLLAGLRAAHRPLTA